MNRKFILKEPQINELRVEIKRYNERVRYAVRTGLSKDVSPKLLRLKDILPTIKGKRDYNKIVADMRRAKKSTLVDIGGITRYEQDKIIREARNKRERYRTQKNKKIESKKVYEIDASRSTQRLPTDRDFLLNELNINPGYKGDVSNKVEEWLSSSNSITRAERWKNNYINRLNDVKFVSPYSQDLMEVINELEEKIMLLSLNEFIIGQILNPADLAITSLYYPSDADAISLLENIIQEWDKLIM